MNDNKEKLFGLLEKLEVRNGWLGWGLGGIYACGSWWLAAHDRWVRSCSTHPTACWRATSPLDLLSPLSALVRPCLPACRC